jgi:chloramphenicol 3-O phosphotransferase
VPRPGPIVILNGVPRSGKSTLATAIQEALPGTWTNLGVDTWMAVTPPHLRPGIGLRPGGERPDLEPAVRILYAALYESVSAHARLGLSVVVDVGHHEAYSEPLGVLADCARRLSGLPVLWVGVRCPLDVIWRRRAQSWGQSSESADDGLRAAVERWQAAVHSHGAYDLEVDTSAMSPGECTGIIADRLAEGPGTAFAALASSS